ncbi:MAG: PEP-CTERM sorting domain-containing protein [Sedimentisphaerales bacterium]|nr:PEP-CTERM sorting domain-containing protein [Sedimentisphaerales bacterium]
MVNKKSRKSAIRSYTLVLTLAVVCLALPGNCNAVDYALLLQQSPVEGGSVEPGTGIHHLGGDSQVILRAVPQPGYQFITWLGDVDEPTAPVTTTYMDSPKIVIAVFERIQYESIEAADLLFGGPGGSGLRRSAGDIGGGSGGGAIRRDYKGVNWKWPDDEEDEDDFPIPDQGDDFPVPDQGDDFPVPGQDVPEPATIVLLIAAAMLTRVRRIKMRA